MKRNLTKVLSLALVALMLAAALASCAGNNGASTGTTAAETVESTEATEATESQSESTSATESKTEESESEEETEGEGEEIVGPKLSGEHAELVENADALKNNVTMYFTDGSRNSVVYENMEMSLEYALDVSLPQQVTSIKNKAGVSYVENTMDVFVTMEDGNTYYARDSLTDATPNVYRFGYYFYQMRVEGQTFDKEFSEVCSEDIDFSKTTKNNDIKGIRFVDGKLTVINNDQVKDPNIIVSSSLNIDASRFNIFEITIKVDANTSDRAELFYVAGDKAGFNSGQRIGFSLVTDGEYHTYKIPLYSGPDYYGTLKGVRLDIGGGGAKYEISGMRVIGADVEGAPAALSLCRSFNVYSDKMHQVIQVAATNRVEGIAEIGMLTAIDADKVTAVVVEDANGIHSSFEDVDWASAEYVGFDIVDAGIFGYILPYDGKGGSISVTLENGEYVIKQSMTPVAKDEVGVIIPSRTDYNAEQGYYNWVAGGNTNDFYIGQRIYTDPTHSFEEFLYEAYCERNPLSDKNIKVYDDRSTDGRYMGYDSLRGVYCFDLAGTIGGFSTPYYREPNKHYKVSFTARGDDVDRMIYVMAHTTIGQLETAVLLDSNDVMLPVPMEVGKNFSESGGERNLYNLDDATYGETIFPMVVNAKEKYEYTILNLYQNWGKYPLKQISWIQYYSPYYHLSTGATETNCILPWMFTDRIWYNTLPDFRGMSAPFWSSQPQHTSAGEHDWLRYVDSDGNVVRWENIQNTIDSYGPTYADVKMDYITTDGKMKVSYTHSEMPQTDENRTYYEMTYEVLEDITINNFVTDFQLYKVDPNDSKGLYQKVGYLNEQNESVVVDANPKDKPIKYVLGDSCPYFSFFDMDGYSNKDGYANLAFLIYNYEFTIGGEQVTPNFAIVNYSDTVYVTLNIEEQTTLQAGDKFVINAILLPWGSEQYDDGIIDLTTTPPNYEYTMLLPDGSMYMDKNVRDVRENTLLNPLTLVAGESCEVVESVFIPKAKTTNGVSAEFTLTGGYNNAAVRVYGFDMMTVPVIYEKINGEWVEYEVSSISSQNTPHAYDGYAIHYDGDGTFSYSFVTTMDGETDRTFKIVVDGNYKKWAKEVIAEAGRTDFMSIYRDPVEMGADNTADVLNNKFISAYEVFEGQREDGLDSYIRFYGHAEDSTRTEAYIYAYKPATPNAESGKYLAVKYRLPETNAETVKNFEFFVSTVISGPRDNSCNFSTKAVIADGEWHVLIFDLTKIEKDTFKEHFVAASDGKYYPQFIRFDFFNRRMSPESYIDVAFVGMDDSIANIFAASVDVSTIRLYEGSDWSIIDPETGEIISMTLKIPEVLVQPSSGYTMSTLEYGAQLDDINGVQYAIQAGSGSHRGLGTHQLFGTTIANMDVENYGKVEGYNLVFGGWAVVEGGIDRYVWSADDGATWHDVISFGKTPSTAASAMVEAAYARSAKAYNFTAADAVRGNFQGNRGNTPTGIAANLEAYKGSTVNIIFGAVPAKDTSTILPMFYIGQVYVPN